MEGCKSVFCSYNCQHCSAFWLRWAVPLQIRDFQRILVMTLPDLARGRKFWKIQNVLLSTFQLCLTHIRSAGSHHAFHWAPESLQVCLAWLWMVQTPARRRAAAHGNSTATPHWTMIRTEGPCCTELFSLAKGNLTISSDYLHWFSKPFWAKFPYLSFIKEKLSTPVFSDTFLPPKGC